MLVLREIFIDKVKRLMFVKYKVSCYFLQVECDRKYKFKIGLILYQIVVQRVWNLFFYIMGYIKYIVGR